MKTILTLLFVGLVAASVPPASAQTAANDLENMLYLDLKSGRVAIQLRPDLAPKQVARIKKLAREKFYDGVVFHRVIDGFMAQTGDPTGTGRGGSNYPDLPAEFSDVPFAQGTVGAARSSNPNSANSQFFICFEAAPFLNGKYTVFGKVVRGMSHVDRIKRGQPRSGAVDNPDKIIRMIVAADAKDHSVLQQGEDRTKASSGARQGSR
ncbi:MAG: peptidylprolyl isomerase [Methyloligellaceae bacterium]